MKIGKSLYVSKLKKIRPIYGAIYFITKVLKDEIRLMLKSMNFVLIRDIVQLGSLERNLIIAEHLCSVTKREVTFFNTVNLD